jgi:hypothetical protein
VDGELDPTLYFMSDETWFHLSGNVNAQNTRYWLAENPHILHQSPLHDQKIRVWCAVSGSRIIGPIFFDTTVNTEVYLRIFEDFYAQLTENEKKKLIFSTGRRHMPHVSPIADPYSRSIHRGTHSK